MSCYWSDFVVQKSFIVTEKLVDLWKDVVILKTNDQTEMVVKVVLNGT